MKQDENGIVATAWDGTNRVPVVVKKMPVTERALLERDILAMLDHPAIPKLIDSYVDDGVLNIVLEFRKGRTLADVCQGQRMKEQDVVHVVRQLTDVLGYLHDTVKIVHRDIKLENIILDDQRNISLIDFGFADHLTDDMTDRLGSPVYCSPEIVQGKSYGANTDVWSMGVVTYYLVDGDLPFEGETIDDVFESICYKQPRISEIVNLSTECKDFLSQVLRKDPKTRLTISEAMRHPWITGQRTKKNLKCLSSVAALTLGGRNSLPIVKPRIRATPSVGIARVRLA